MRATQHEYRVGFPWPGPWRETFNSDVYDGWVNPGVVGKGGQIIVEPTSLHGFPSSAALVLPANSVLIFSVH